MSGQPRPPIRKFRINPGFGSCKPNGRTILRNPLPDYSFIIHRFSSKVNVFFKDILYKSPIFFHFQKKIYKIVHRFRFNTECRPKNKEAEHFSHLLSRAD